MLTRDRTGIIWATVTLVLAAYMSCAGRAQTRGQPAPPLDVESLEVYAGLIVDYMPEAIRPLTE